MKKYHHISVGKKSRGGEVRTIPFGKNIKAHIAYPPGSRKGKGRKGKGKIITLLFNPDKYTMPEAKKWAKDHNYIPGKTAKATGRKNPLVDSLVDDIDVDEVLENPKRTRKHKRRKYKVCLSCGIRFMSSKDVSLCSKCKDKEKARLEEDFLDDYEDMEALEKPLKRRKNAILMVGNPSKKRKNPIKRKARKKSKKRKKKNPILMVGNPFTIPIISPMFNNDLISASAVLGGGSVALISLPKVFVDVVQSIKNKKVMINNPSSLFGLLGGSALIGYYFYRENQKKITEN